MPFCFLWRIYFLKTLWFYCLLFLVVFYLPLLLKRQNLPFSFLLNTAFMAVGCLQLAWETCLVFLLKSIKKTQNFRSEFFNYFLTLIFCYYLFACDPSQFPFGSCVCPHPQGLAALFDFIIYLFVFN